MWEHQAFLSPLEWDVLRRIDGTTAVGQIATTLVAEGLDMDLAEVREALWRLQVEGFVMFYAAFASS